MNKINISNFLFRLVLGIDDQLLSFINKEAKLFRSFDDLEFAALNQKQKNQFLKSWDRLFSSKPKLLLPEAEKIFQTEINFEIFFKFMRFPLDERFLQFWQHLQIVDQINQQIENDSLNQEDFEQLDQFFSQFGALTLNDQTFASIWQEVISHNDRQAALNSLLGLLIFSVFAHLDILVHQWIFDNIEPICLGWLFSKKLHPRNYQWQDGKPQKINQHKGAWTNPCRSLMTLMATFASLKLDKQYPESIYGLNFADYLLSHTEQKDNFIKKANEGNSISYTEFLWLLSDTDKKTDVFNFHHTDSQVQQETQAILKQQPILYAENKNPILFIWLIYHLFQMDYENQPKNQAFLHGYYYEFWELFSSFYQRNQSPCINQWPEDLVKMAQPVID